MGPTELLYFTDPSTSGSATVTLIGTDTAGPFVVLDKTLFHPAGGGQKSDRGRVGEIPLLKAEKHDAHVLHFLERAPEFGENTTVGIEIDADARRLNSRYHTAGHLVGSVLETVLKCKAVSGQHWAGEAFMRFEREVVPTADELVVCNDMIAAIIAENRPVTVALDGTMRFVTIAGFPAVGCGGTHLASTGGIGPVELGNPKVKQRKLQVSYRLTA